MPLYSINHKHVTRYDLRYVGEFELIRCPNSLNQEGILCFTHKEPLMEWDHQITLEGIVAPKSLLAFIQQTQQAILEHDE